MIKKKLNYFIIFFITITFFILKYSYSLIYFKSDFFITKILIETGDIQYYPLVKSLSQFELNPTYNNYFVANKIITFPYFSLIWHSILFKFLGYYSFFLLEFIFIFLTYLILYKIFKKFEISDLFSIFFGLLILSLPSLFNFFEPLNLKYFELINQLIKRNFGNIFPRPLVAFFYLYLFLYFLICFHVNKKSIFILPLSITLFLMANSFYIYFITSFFLLLFSLLFISKKNIVNFIKENNQVFFLSFIIILSGLFLIFYQNLFGEPDYSRRLGFTKISLYEKTFLLKYFLKNLFRLEIIFLISLVLILNSNVKKIFTNIKVYNLLIIFFYFFICSLIAPFIFVIISPVIIHIYQFFDFIILTSFFYILFFLINFFYEKFKNSFYQKFLINTLCFFLLILTFLHHKNNVINPIVNQDTVYTLNRSDVNLINKFLLENSYKKSNKLLFTNDNIVINLWLFNQNKFLSVPESFANSLNDNQIERSLFIAFRSLNLSENDLKRYLDLKNSSDRNFFSTFFYGSKYQANSFKKFSDINDYLLEDRVKILNAPPLRSHSNFLPESEKSGILLRYKKFRLLNYENTPDLIILNKNAFINFSPKQYLKKLETVNYIIFERVNF